MGEKVIVRGHVGQPHNPEPVMTVAQHERIVAGLEARLREVLARDAAGAGDCNCINVSRKTEREYEQGCCPHQRARAFLAQTAEGVT